MEKWSKDSLILQRRKGTSDSPYIDINESLKIDGTNRVNLRELPSKYHGVSVTGDGKNWFEVEKAIEKNTEFIVDYESGMVTFHQSHSGKQLNFSYKGTGQSFTPANRIYTKREGQTVVETLEEITTRTEEQADLVDQILQTGNVSSVNGKTGMVDGLAEKSEVDAMDNRLTSQLNENAQEIESLDITKADKNFTETELNILQNEKMDKSTKDIAVTQINKNKGLFDETYFTEEVKQQWTGNTPISSVPANGSTTTEKLADSAVTPEKTDFARKSKNLFDKDAALLGYRIDATTGEPVAYEGWSASDFIPVTSQTSYSKSHNSMISEYDNNKQFIAIGSNNAQPFNTRSNTAFVRVSLNLNYMDNYQLEIGSQNTSYESYGLKLDNYKAEIGNEINENVIGKLNTLQPFSKDDYPDKLYDITPDINSIRAWNTRIKKDYVNSWGRKTHGIKVEVDGGKTVDLIQEYTNPLHIPHVQAVSAFFYVDNPANLNSFSIQLEHAAGGGFQWNRAITTFKKGWNLFRQKSETGVMGDWADFHKIRVVLDTSGSVNVTIGLIFMEQPKKARLLFVEDGGYVEFLERGYPDLKQRGIPTTWALNPGILGERRRITEAQVDELANDFMSEFSFHSWASEVHSTMTSEEVADNAIKCVRWLQRKGLEPDYLFRAAITQNNAPNHDVLKYIVDAYCNAEEVTGLEIFPFANPYGANRMILHGRSTERMDELFDILKKTHCLMIGYTHGIGDPLDGTPAIPADMTQAEWDYFLSKVDVGLSEGWLEGTTYNRLRKDYTRKTLGDTFDSLIKAT